MYNLVNIVTSPTRITEHSVTQIDVIVTNKQVVNCSTSVLDLGYSDHLAPILKINVISPDRGPQMGRIRQLIEEGIQECSRSIFESKVV
jgi:hypothetical protein